MIGHIKKILMLAEARGIDLDSPQAMEIHRRIILNKPFLLKWYEIYFNAVGEVEAETAHLGGVALELGSGAGLIKTVYPDIITSDTVINTHIDRVEDAVALSFADGSLRAVYCLNTLHHISDARRFLSELNRCLMPGGVALMVEPAMSRFARFVWRYLHHENCQPGWGWQFPNDGRMSGSNSALPWIVFDRDRELFNEGFPCLNDVEIRYFDIALYLLSGGVSYRALAPVRVFKYLRAIEKIIPQGMMKDTFALFQIIRVSKSAPQI
ncbi:methyltransferase domain-containing protein [Candidatus Magnetominusculus dajiuhuensis]|uniref:methyltransferase domain-containing protein n=1 Tax=Candidatus Magnetominusculus dajiuhuensis TaxID=3137712 RepID=UPI003B437870